MYERNLPKLPNRLLALNFNVMSSFNSNHISAKGLTHNKNEDSFLVEDNLVIIADGMGGEACGEISSRIAVKSIFDILKHCKSDELTAPMIKERMYASILSADKNIRDYIADHPQSDGMGTTALIALMGGSYIHIAWCGDSHCFRFNNGRIYSLTKDHSYVQELIDQRKISIEDSFRHPDNNLITRFVGGGKDTCEPEFISHKVKKGDMFILCSDGLSGYCMTDEINRCISSNHSLSELPSQLMELAKTHGSDDDITIVVIDTGSDRPRKLNWVKRIFQYKKGIF